MARYTDGELALIVWHLTNWVTNYGANDPAEVLELLDDGFILDREVRAAIERGELSEIGAEHSLELLRTMVRDSIESEVELGRR